MKALKPFFISVIFLLFVCCSYNFFVDKLGVFGNKYKFLMNTSCMHNEAFVKKQFLSQILKNNQRFTNFLMGSSNVMKMCIDDFPEIGWYSYSDFYQTPYDMIDNLKFLLGLTRVDNLVVFIEPEYLYIDKISSDKQKDNYLSYKLPDDLKGKVIFYLKYLYKNPFHKEKEELSIQEKINLFMDGSHVDAEHNRLSDFNTVNVIQNIDYNNDKIDDLIAVLSQISDICSSNHIKLTIVLTPQYYEKMSKFNPEHIKKFKYLLSEISDYYDYWINNKITADKNSFNSNCIMTYETSKKLVDSIFYERKFYEKNEKFGIYVEKGKYYDK